MTEDEALSWVKANFSLATFERLNAYVDLLIRETQQQNLISASTITTVWARHIVDSLQLLRFSTTVDEWLDVGSGAGLPGIVLACAAPIRITLVEPRRRRVEFLQECVNQLSLRDRVTIRLGKDSQLASGHYRTVTARAVASMGKLLSGTAKVTGRNTVFIFPRGASGQAELAELRMTWHGVFHVEQSIVDPASQIVIATDVRRR